MTQVARTGSLTDVAGHPLHVRAHLSFLPIGNNIFFGARTPVRASSFSLLKSLM